jgi:serine/threonine protein phosphatase PrpC/predicted Ser/Thr protein kinase
MKLHYGHHTHAGCKPINQDAHNGCCPARPLLSIKGAAFAIADGISSSTVSQYASQYAIKTFMENYYLTADVWSPAYGAEKVLQSINAHLYTQTQESSFCYDPDKGYVCTFSGLVLHQGRAYIVHVGDSQISLLRNNQLQTLTTAHRVTSEEASYLGRALGVEQRVLIDAIELDLQAHDQFILATDGVFEYIQAQDCITTIKANHDHMLAAQQLVELALANGSDDNLTIQIVTLASLDKALGQRDNNPHLPLPPLLEIGDIIDGYHIERELQASNRSHVYLAHHKALNETLVLKLPSIDLRDNQDYLNQLAMEEWIIRKVHSPHVIAIPPQQQARHYFYLRSEYIEGSNLHQWIRDHPKPSLERVRSIVEQVGAGLIAMHRVGVLHQDIRPENIMIMETGKVKIIDLGSARLLGVTPLNQESVELQVLGTAMYAAPEYFLGDMGTEQSDLFSLAVLTYYLLSGHYPYGTHVAKCRTVAAQHKLKYTSVLDANREIPGWLDETLKKALQPNPLKRYATLSEFLYNLRHPNPAFLARVRAPLIDRHPVKFWKTISLVLALVCIGLSIRLFSGH